MVQGGSSKHEESSIPDELKHQAVQFAAMFRTDAGITERLSMRSEMNLREPLVMEKRLRCCLRWANHLIGLGAPYSKIAIGTDDVDRKKTIVKMSDEVFPKATLETGQVKSYANLILKKT
ncbi:hypothetical protein L6164_007421 [Bauhinia variegata]|uniref:Uncharacterized protein n=1 Tax=Bauhinia variegata TaxID=167791 RepID=A0ACB9PEN3_BAUVA|nr:hypothetical protein L6164_007421 [Bauhinia variegata]